MTVIISRRVYLEPQFLDENIMTHLLAKIVEITNKECTKDYGHILSVNRLVKVVNLEDTIFTVEFEAETLKPTVGDKLSGNVCMLYKDGIFVQVSEKQKMLIPSLSIKGYVYDETTHTYSNGKNKIKDGDKINAIVTASQYNKQNFSCIGCLA
jgi:DNA-directed RNA polymerase subunit E'/Rpb7